jgi:hypothetical protein
VIDTKTVYLRLPDTFIEPEALLIVLRNLMRQAYDRERSGEPQPVAPPPPAIENKPPKAAESKASKPVKSEGARDFERAAKLPSSSVASEIEKLASLHAQGILTDAEFAAAKKRALAKT